MTVDGEEIEDEEWEVFITERDTGGLGRGEEETGGFDAVASGGFE